LPPPIYRGRMPLWSEADLDASDRAAALLPAHQSATLRNKTCVDERAGSHLLIYRIKKEGTPSRRRNEKRPAVGRRRAGKCAADKSARRYLLPLSAPVNNKKQFFTATDKTPGAPQRSCPEITVQAAARSRHLRRHRLDRHRQDRRRREVHCLRPPRQAAGIIPNFPSRFRRLRQTLRIRGRGMSKAVQQAGTPSASEQPAKVPTVDAFRARCEARAWLVAEGELTLPDAVDELQESALASGIVAAIGQD
jgi:hypothetical protein